MNISPERDILPHLKNGHDAKLVFSHRYVGAIGAEGGSYQFLDPADTRAAPRARPLRGLTTVLARLYWPTFSYWRNKKGNVSQNPALRSTLQSVAQVLRNKRRRLEGGSGITPIKPAAMIPTAALGSLTTAARGAVRGTIMHRQMEDLMTLDAESFRRRNPDGEHPWTTRLFLAIVEKGLLPLQSEFRVADPDLGIATRIDLVAVAEDTGDLHFLEYKTAASRELFKVGDTTNAPFERALAATGLANSALNRAMIQATVGAQMAIRMMGLRGNPKVAVVLVTDQAVDFIYCTDDFMLGTSFDVYQDMLTAIKEERDAAAETRKKGRAQRRDNTDDARLDSVRAAEWRATEADAEPSADRDRDRGQLDDDDDDEDEENMRESFFFD